MRCLVSLVLGLGLLLQTVPAAADAPAVSPEVRQRIQRDGSTRILVRLRLPAGPLVPEGSLASQASVLSQRRDIANVQTRVTGRLRNRPHTVLRRFQTVPVLALEVGADALRELEASLLDVESVTVDQLRRPFLGQSVPFIEGDLAWANGFDGTGMTVAVLDTGVDRTHPFLQGKVVEEACYSSTIRRQAQTVCPNKKDEQIGVGAAQPCSLPDCIHGTHVAGIVAGDGVPAGVAFSGVAPGAQLMAVQVFSRITSASLCGGTAPCLGAYDSDIIAGLERVYQLRSTYQFAAVNLSLGGGSFTSPCDTDPHKPMIDNLRSVGIATVVAAGNDGSPNALAEPACVSTAVSVGSVDLNDEVSWFSNYASFLSLLAPGESITSALVGGSYIALDGTSMATPHVAGAWAVLKQAAPGASVDEILTALTSTGVPVTELFTGVTKPRIRVLHALATLTTTPLIGAITPSKGGQGTTIEVTIDGANFQGGATVTMGAGITVSPVSVTVDRIVVQASIDLAAALGPRTVTVLNPDGSSATRTGAFTVTLPPPHAALVFNGKVRDRVGQGELALSPDGANDGTLTATVTGGPRTVSQVQLATSAGGAWDTVPGNSYWVLGVAGGLDQSLLNAADGSVSFPVVEGGSFVVFATDYLNSKFTPGTTLTLTVRFTDDTEVSASAVVPVVPTVTGVTPGSGEVGATVGVTVSGTSFQAGATVSVGPGVTVTDVSVTSATQLQATFAIATDAAEGARDVQVTNPGGGQGTLTGGFTVTAPGEPPPPPPPPPGITLVFNGKVADRVGPSEYSLAGDGANDGTLTATVTGGARTVRQLSLASSSGGRWDTIPGNAYWVVGAAAEVTTPLLNQANGSVSFPVGDGATFMVFATDWYNAHFQPGATLTLTVTFTDDTVAVGATTVGP
jgi:subtilisin family serine protease